MNLPRVAIIGGGCSGVLVALQLLRRSIQAPLELVIIEKSPALGRGLAYTVPSDRCKLNVPADSMGAFPEDPRGFLTWLHKSGHSMKAEDFASRALFGDYLQHLLEHHRSHAARSRLTHIQDEACDISYDQKTNAFAITLADHSLHVADVCVLALGNMGRSMLNGIAIDSVFSSPYDPHSYRNISEMRELLIVGTGLTAIDCVLEAEGRGFTGRYTMISRHGYFPLPHEAISSTAGPADAPALPEPSSLLALSLRDLARRIVTESRRIGSSQPCITALRPHLQNIWSHLSASDKRRFLRHVRPLWEVHRHRIPRPHAHHVQSLIESKRLSVHAGRLTSAGRSERGITVQITPSLPDTPRYFDTAMLCSGPESDLTKIEMPLVKNLLRSGVIAPGELGLGVHATKTTLPESGRNRLKLIGPLQRESLWEITAVRELRLEAEKLAHEIRESLLAV